MLFVTGIFIYIVIKIVLFVIILHILFYRRFKEKYIGELLILYGALMMMYTFIATYHSAQKGYVYETIVQNTSIYVAFISSILGIFIYKKKALYKNIQHKDNGEK
jgi:hypothetical protein